MWNRTNTEEWLRELHHYESRLEIGVDIQEMFHTPHQQVLLRRPRRAKDVALKLYREQLPAKQHRVAGGVLTTSTSVIMK